MGQISRGIVNYLTGVFFKNKNKKVCWKFRRKLLFFFTKVVHQSLSRTKSPNNCNVVNRSLVQNTAWFFFKKKDGFNLCLFIIICAYMRKNQIGLSCEHNTGLSTHNEHTLQNLNTTQRQQWAI